MYNIISELDIKNLKNMKNIYSLKKPALLKRRLIFGCFKQNFKTMLNLFNFQYRKSDFSATMIKNRI